MSDAVVFEVIQAGGMFAEKSITFRPLLPLVVVVAVVVVVTGTAVCEL